MTGFLWILWLLKNIDENIEFSLFGFHSMQINEVKCRLYANIKSALFYLVSTPQTAFGEFKVARTAGLLWVCEGLMDE
jgi:hypothetical protein